jgi:Flp pilus assembly protein TadD
MTKIRLIVVLIAVAVIAAATFVRVQPSGAATVFQRGTRISARTTPVYIRVIGATQCRVAKISGNLGFDHDVHAITSGGDELTMRVRFTYRAPESIPTAGPRGPDWCATLSTQIAAITRRASAQHSTADILDRQRQTTDAIADGIQRSLRAAGVIAESVSARAELPSGFERLRPIAEVAARAQAARPVIFIGLDAADWNLLDGYMASGVMPNLKKLVDHGTKATPLTELPPLSPIVWTTMMTGVSPLQHQILDFTRFNPYTHEKEPITSDERRAPAIWNMLTYAGKSAAVFGLWATYAAEPVHAINVSDRLFTFLYSEGQRPPRVVYPPQRQLWAEERVAGAERAVDLARMREYLPSLTESEFAALSKVENPYAEPPAALRRILVDTEIYRRLSLDYLRQRVPDLTIVYFEGTDTIGHVFAPFAPPKQPRISQADYDRYSGIPEKYFRYIDSILGDYIDIAFQTNAVIVIASDHGFRWKEGRPEEISSTATATAAKWHRNEAIFVSSIPTPPPKGIRDLCGVLLRLTGMPELDYARYFERAAPPPAPTSSRAADEDLAKLRALGYIGSGESTRSALPQNDTKTAGAYNNAGLILRNDHRVGEAIASFDRALQIDPRYASAMWNLSETLFDANRDLDRADSLLVTALQNGLADGPRFVIVRSIAYQRTGRSARCLPLLERAVAASPNDPELHMFRGRYRMDRHDCGGALEDFLFAEQRAPANALAYASAGLAQSCLGDAAAAQASFAHARQLDPTLEIR